jgi:hypothetical protein
MGHPMSKINLLIHILCNLHDGNETSHNLLENDLENEVATVDRMKETMSKVLKSLDKVKNMLDNKLICSDTPANFKGSCYYCEIYYHKGFKCKTQEKGKCTVQEMQILSRNVQLPTKRRKLPRRISHVLTAKLRAILKGAVKKFSRQMISMIEIYKDNFSV